MQRGHIQFRSRCYARGRRRDRFVPLQGRYKGMRAFFRGLRYSQIAINLVVA